MYVIGWKSKEHHFGNNFCNSSFSTGYDYFTLVIMMMKYASIIKYSEGFTQK